MKFRIAGQAIIAAFALTGVGRAQQAPPPASVGATSRLAYEAAYYAQFSPRTALDMVNQTPGFVLIEGAERRGFSGAVGNVLIDGQRPIAKSQTLADILQRIPAAQVVRIELLRGGEAAADASGQAVVANVVRTPSAGQGAFSLGAEYAGRAPVPDGRASWSGRIGRTDYSLGVSGYSLMRNLPGDREIRGGDGALLATRADESPRSFYQIGINGEVGRQTLGGRLRLTGQAFHSRYHEDSRILTFAPDGALTQNEFNPYTETQRTLETGVNYERGLGRWDLTLSALLTRKRFASDISSTDRDTLGAVESVFTQTLARDSGETILRMTMARDLSSTHHLEIGAEAAVNTLDARLALTLDLGSGPFQIPVPNSNLSVVERRGEAFVSHVWRPSRLWSVESRLAGEISRLSFTGDTDQSVSLAYLKPSIQVTRMLGARDQLRLRLYRDVGQLDFTDFVSAASLTDDIIKGGNPDLRPETSWRVEAAADLHFGAQGAATLTVFHHWLSDAVDLVPVGPPGARFDAPGNIGGGEVYGLHLNLRLPLRPLIPGGVVTLDTVWRHAAVTDPLTGERRTISDFKDHELIAEFRQDRPADRVAWGVKYTGQAQRTSFRLNEIDRRRDSPSMEAWIETTRISGLNLRLTVLSLLGTPERRVRTFFSSDRTGAVDRIERSEKRPGRWLLLTASGNF